MPWLNPGSMPLVESEFSRLKISDTLPASEPDGGDAFLIPSIQAIIVVVAAVVAVAQSVRAPVVHECHATISPLLPVMHVRVRLRQGHRRVFIPLICLRQTLDI